MPDFRVALAGTPALSNELWEDPASATRPTRVPGLNDRQFRQLKAQLNTVLTVTAIILTEAAPQPDTDVGLFTMWPVEHPTVGGPPAQSTPTPGQSAVQEFTLGQAGHYTIAVRHEDLGGGGVQERPGGVMVFHVEVLP